MKATRPSVLLLDVMDTLVYDPFFVDMPAFFGMSLDELLAAKHPTAWMEFERGEIDETEMLERFFLDRRPFDHDALLEMMRDSYRWLEGSEDLGVVVGVDVGDDFDLGAAIAGAGARLEEHVALVRDALVDPRGGLWALCATDR